LNLVVCDAVDQKGVGSRQARVQVNDVLLEPFEIGGDVVNDVGVCSHISFIAEIVVIVVIIIQVGMFGFG
jgi:hypothetical protein